MTFCPDLSFVCTTYIGAASLLAVALFMVSLATFALSRWTPAAFEGGIRGPS